MFATTTTTLSQKSLEFYHADIHFAKDACLLLLSKTHTPHNLTAQLFAHNVDEPYPISTTSINYQPTLTISASLSLFKTALKINQSPAAVITTKRFAWPKNWRVLVCIITKRSKTNKIEINVIIHFKWILIVKINFITIYKYSNSSLIILTG